MVRMLYGTYVTVMMFLLFLELMALIAIEHLVMAILGLVGVIMLLTQTPSVLISYKDNEANPSIQALNAVKQFLLIILPLIIYIFILRIR